MAAQQKVEAYQFTSEFERAVMWLACNNPRFWRRVGHGLDADAMPTEVGKLVIKACVAVVHDSERAPDAAMVVIQRLRRWQYEGKVSHEQVLAAHDALDEAEDLGLPSEDSVVAELAPILKRRVHQVVVQTAMTDYAQKQDFSRVVSLISEAERLGMVEEGPGIKLGPGSTQSFDAIERVRDLQRLPMGIYELDQLMGGGVPRGQLVVFVGAPGSGKSMALSHAGAHALSLGLFVVYATLELPDTEVLCRIKANLMNVMIDTVKDSGDEVKAKWAERSQGLGTCLVRNFTAGATTVQDITTWVEGCEQHEGRTVDLLLVDYADKLGTIFRSKRDMGPYQGMQEVYESLRTYAERRRMWSATASQASRGGSKDRKNGVVDLADVADSMHKSRVADIVITLNERDDGDQILFYVAKNRTGKGRFSVGPLPCDYACGQIAMITSVPPGQEDLFGPGVLGA